jgi:hypothetical protein
MRLGSQRLELEAPQFHLGGWTMSRLFTAGNHFELPDASGLSLPIGPPGLTFFVWVKFDVTGTPETRRGFYRYEDAGPPVTRFSTRSAWDREAFIQSYDASGVLRNTPFNEPTGYTIPEDVWIPSVVSYRAEDNYAARVVNPYILGPIAPHGNNCYVHGVVSPTLRIGAEGSNNLLGKMAHFTIYGRGLADAEIDALMAGAAPLSIDGAVHYWPMLDGTGGIIDTVNSVTVPMVGTVGTDAADNPPVDSIEPPQSGDLSVTITDLPSDTLLYGWLAQWV